MASSSSRFLKMLKILAFISGLGMVLFVFWSLTSHGRARSIKVSHWPALPTAQMPKLLSEMQLRNLFTYDGVWLFPKNECTCDNAKKGGYIFPNAYDPHDLPAVAARREMEYGHFQRREGLPHPPPLLAPPNLPFGYPIHGLELMPLHTVPIPGLQFEGPDAPNYMVTLKASLGTLHTLADVPDDVVQGRGTKQMTISTSDRMLLNFILQHVTYTSTVYQLHGVDVVSLKSKSSVAKFPVTIRYPVIPKLRDPGAGRKLKDLVTIATKTFLRPHKFKTMLQSLRKYYPDLTVIVADDSKEPLEILDEHVEYYTMPFGKGWFAGRNLAISQVTTKYVLWVDDDFLFTSETKIEVLVDVLEKTELDVVGGSVMGNTFHFKLLLEQSRHGDCIHRISGSFRPLEGFPDCVVTSAVVNFFLAHTERLQKVGFDPLLQRVAHTEFFMDGLGSLLVGSCSNVIISHQSHSSSTDSKLASLEKTYDSYRDNTNAQIQFKLALHYFKNHFHCYT